MYAKALIVKKIANKAPIRLIRKGAASPRHGR